MGEYAATVEAEFIWIIFIHLYHKFAGLYRLHFEVTIKSRMNRLKTLKVISGNKGISFKSMEVKKIVHRTFFVFSELEVYVLYVYFLHYFLMIENFPNYGIVVP